MICNGPVLWVFYGLHFFPFFVVIFLFRIALRCVLSTSYIRIYVYGYAPFTLPVVCLAEGFIESNESEARISQWRDLRHN